MKLKVPTHGSSGSSMIAFVHIRIPDHLKAPFLALRIFSATMTNSLFLTSQEAAIPFHQPWIQLCHD